MLRRFLRWSGLLRSTVTSFARGGLWWLLCCFRHGLGWPLCSAVVLVLASASSIVVSFPGEPVFWFPRCFLRHLFCASRVRLAFSCSVGGVIIMARLDRTCVDVPLASAASVSFCGFRGWGICFLGGFYIPACTGCWASSRGFCSVFPMPVVGFCLHGVSFFCSALSFSVLGGIASWRLFLGCGGSRFHIVLLFICAVGFSFSFLVLLLYHYLYLVFPLCLRFRWEMF